MTRTLKTAHKLVRSRQEVNNTLLRILTTYDENKIFNDKALLKTLSMYSDFYDWLQGRESKE